MAVSSTMPAARGDGGAQVCCGLRPYAPLAIAVTAMMADVPGGVTASMRCGYLVSPALES